MNKVTRYIILPELSLIIEYLGGKVDGEDAINLKIVERKDQNYNPNYFCLVDFRDIEILMDDEGVKSMSKFIDHFKGEKTVVGNRKIALLTSKPQQVVLSSLLKEFSIELSMDIEIFSSLQASMAYINCLPGNTLRIKDELARLRINTA